MKLGNYIGIFRIANTFHSPLQYTNDGKQCPSKLGTALMKSYSNNNNEIDTHIRKRALPSTSIHTRTCVHGNKWYEI